MKVTIEIECGDLHELLAHLSIIRSGLKKKVAANWDTDKDFTFEDANCYGDHQVAVEFLSRTKQKPTPMILIAFPDGTRWQAPLKVAVEHRIINDMGYEKGTKFFKEEFEDLMRNKYGISDWIFDNMTVKDFGDNFQLLSGPEGTVKENYRDFGFSKATLTF